ncbi:hypothetical protein [Tenacibaculum ovolyticum]|uniref:hypothetical protein n=1 Tax=Tenacibaculum ovolyticum TaxID=104270 RepID=UPI00041BAB85|nr:hypothetical protein [Tenacibaculum ovolyticum]
MKVAFKVIALIFVLGFISCTDNDNIVPENERTELQAVNKEDITAPGSGGDDPDLTED